MSTIFVAGAAGTVGSALTAQLVEAGANVVAGVHGKNDAKVVDGAEVRGFDFADAESMDAAMAGCDRMFLALPLMEGMTRFGHQAVEAAKRAGVEYIVRSSAYAASSDAHWKLGREHGMVDQFVEDSGIPFTVLRPNCFMQNFLNGWADMVRNGSLALPIGEAAISLIDVRDLAGCAAKLLQDSTGYENSFYALTGPEGITLAQAADILKAKTGKDISAAAMEEDAFVADLKESGMPEWTVTMQVSLVRIVKLGMAGNVTKAVEYLTDTPARTFDAFAEEFASAWS